MAQHGRWGFWKCFDRLRALGHPWNHQRAYRLFNVLDEGHHEALAIAVDVSLPSVRAIAVLEQLCAIYGRPRQRRCDNGPEFLADAMKSWGEQHGIHIHFIEPGKPNQHAYIERFNNSFRTEVLDVWVFASLDEVRDVSEPLCHAYNTERSHESLGRVSHSPSSRDQLPPPTRLISNCALDGEASG